MLDCQLLLRIKLITRSITTLQISILMPQPGTSKFDGAAPVEISVAADAQDLKGLVKEKRHGCFRGLGGDAVIGAALASSAETSIQGDDHDVRGGAPGAAAGPTCASRKGAVPAEEREWQSSAEQRQPEAVARGGRYRASTAGAE